MSRRTTCSGFPASSARRAAVSRACSLWYIPRAPVCASAASAGQTNRAISRTMKWRMRRSPRLPELGIHGSGVVLRHEDLAGLAAGACRDETLGLHHVDEPRRAAESDAQAALQVRDRGLAALHDDAGGLVVEIVLLEFDGVGRLVLGGDRLVVVRTSLLAQEAGQARALLFGDVGAVQPDVAR